MDIYAVILAAGQGKRMQSNLYKVLHPVCDKPMLQHVITVANKINPKEVLVVVGHGAEEVKKNIGDSVTYALQDKQLGTGHALKQVENELEGRSGTTIVMCGDTPLITVNTINSLLMLHEKTKSAATVLTAIAPNPKGYGRIVRDEKGSLVKIVEEKDCNEFELGINEINVATYCFDNELLFEGLQKINNKNAQSEYYLTDVIEILKNEGHNIAGYCTPDFSETMGVNDRLQLSEAECVMSRRINKYWMARGVTFLNSDTTTIGTDVQLGRDVVIYPGTIITGSTTVGDNCTIGPNTQIVNSFIGGGSTISNSVVISSSVGMNANVGPYAHLRPNTIIDSDVRIGNFVEIKGSSVGNRSKVSHLSYVGDAEIGQDVNIGCGAVTVNYDGKNKHTTTIDDGAFIGCNANLIAPVNVGKEAIVAAGSTVAKNTPAKALAIERSNLIFKENYRGKKNNK